VETVNYLILVPMVYMAWLILIAGLFYKTVEILKKPQFTPTLRIYPVKKQPLIRSLVDALFIPSVLKRKPVLWVFLMIFHGSLLLLLIGHLELIKEFSIIQIIPHYVFIGGGFVGLIILISVIFFLFRRFLSPVREVSVPEDYLILILLLLITITGAQMDWARNWYDYDIMGVDEYRGYLSSMLQFKPDITDVTESGHTFMLVLHVFFVNIFLSLFPFSKMVHSIFSIPLNVIRRR